MNNEELLQTADAMRAFVEGKPVQYWDKIMKEWIEPVYPPLWDCRNILYRPKPRPKRVHWSKPEHVPGPVCWLRKLNSEHSERMILAIAPHGVYIACAMGGYARFLPFREMGTYEHSTDRVNWHPCEVEEQ